MLGGRWLDKIFIERLWRPLKYEAVYLHDLTDGFKAERFIGEWIGFYNTERPHSSLDGQTPPSCPTIGVHRSSLTSRNLTSIAYLAPEMSY